MTQEVCHFSDLRHAGRFCHVDFVLRANHLYLICAWIDPGVFENASLCDVGDVKLIMLRWNVKCCIIGICTCVVHPLKLELLCS